MRGGPAWLGFHWNSIWLRARPHMTSQCTWGSMTTYVILEVCWDGLWTLSFGLSQWSQHLARVWSGPNLHVVGGVLASIARFEHVRVNTIVKTWPKTKHLIHPSQEKRSTCNILGDWVRDNRKLLGDSGEAPILKRSGWRVNSRWEIFSFFDGGKLHKIWYLVWLTIWS